MDLEVIVLHPYYILVIPYPNTSCPEGLVYYRVGCICEFIYSNCYIAVCFDHLCLLSVMNHPEYILSQHNL